MKRFSPILLILLLSAFVRFHALARDARFQPDEALFATFARSAALNGAWLLPGALDKPPLTIYLMAFSMSFAARGSMSTLLDIDTQQGEFAARVPNTYASLLLVAVTFALTRRCYRDKRIAIVSALLVACSPFTVLFGASAFTDTWMLLGMTLALWMAAAKRPLWSGIYLALGFASKQQALFYVPLILVLFAFVPHPPMGIRKWLSVLPRFLLPLIIVAVLLLLWDTTRAQVVGFWALAAENNSPAGFVPLDEILPRIGVWFNHGSALFGQWWLTALLLVSVFACRRTRLNIILLIFTLAYSLLHWLVALNLYDRYLLLLLPPLALLTAHGIVRLWDAPRKGTQFLRLAIAAVVGALLFSAAWDASEGRASIDNGRAHDSILELADFLNQQSLGAIVYDRWLGWELGYYMGQWTDKRRVYYPTPDILVEDALLQSDPAPRYFVTPTDRPFAAWLIALQNGGFTIFEAYNAPPYVVYRLIPSWTAGA